MNTWTLVYNGPDDLHLMTYQTRAKAFRNEMKVGDSFLALLKHRGSISGPMTRAAHR